MSGIKPTIDKALRDKQVHIMLHVCKVRNNFNFWISFLSLIYSKKENFIIKIQSIVLHDYNFRLCVWFNKITV